MRKPPSSPLHSCDDSPAFLPPKNCTQKLHHPKLNFTRFQNTTDKDKKLEAILKTHFDFERIHPFSDRNGRVGRMLIFYSCLQENIIPPIIQKEDKTSISRF
ncbi:Fic family protein [Helicobacter pametensis]|uniref:Fic family protein n=1 Tax=Helicobacter pametensis TaxID=95149 RepID=UPI003B838354